MDIKLIDAFRGEYRFLSNFWLTPITLPIFNTADPCNPTQVTFPSTENAYQAMKTTDPQLQMEFAAIKPGAAKEKGALIKQQGLLRPDWLDISVSIMANVCLQKFINDANCRAKLLATGFAYLEEGNTWHDNFYGRCTCGGNPSANCPGNSTGENHLGLILMGTRELIRQHRKEA